MNDEDRIDKLLDYEKRIADLEAELSQCLDCCKRVGELEAENERLKSELQLVTAPQEDQRKYWMERAAEIANTQCTETNECPVWKQIRAELEK